LEADLFDSAQRSWWMAVASNKEPGEFSEDSGEKSRLH